MATALMTAPHPFRHRGTDLGEIAAQWREARRIYPIYAEMARRFDLGPPCREMECPINRAEPEVVARFRQWFARMDERIEACHLRIVAQTTALATEDNLRALLTRYLAKEHRTAAGRDKIDFLLVQYFDHCVPHSFHCRDLDLEDVAGVLEPVLGEASTHKPRWLDPLDDFLKALKQCRSLGDLLERGILQQVRQLKNSAGAMYYGSAALLAFTRFNFLMRRSFFRLMYADLQAIRRGLRQLEARGVKAIDCRRARLSAEEPPANLRRICHEWKQPFRAAYTAGQSFQQLVAIRAAVEETLAHYVTRQQEIAQAAGQQPAGQEQAPETAKPDAVEEAAAPAPGLDSTAAAVSLPGNELRDCIQQIAGQLAFHSQRDPLAGETVTVGRALLRLSSWEVADFGHGATPYASAIQRAVAARASLLDAVLESQRAGVTACFAHVLDLAHSEAAQIQECIAQAKDEGNIDAAVNLAATAKRLLLLIERAEELESQCHPHTEIFQ